MSINTPWKFGNTGPEQRMILDANDQYVASVQIFQTPRQMGAFQETQREANAAFILKAANAHSSLIEALEACEEHFDDRADADCDQDGYIPNAEMRLLQVVREALRKAGA